MQWIVLTTSAWLLGLTVYLLALKGFYGQTISRGDFIVVLLWSWAAAVVASSTIYAPCLFLLKKLLRGCRPGYLFSLAGFALGLVPTMLIIVGFGGNLRSLLSHEAFLFSCMFSAFGLVMGYGFVKLYETPSHSESASLPRLQA